MNTGPEMEAVPTYSPLMPILSCHMDAKPVPSPRPIWPMSVAGHGCQILCCWHSDGPGLKAEETTSDSCRELG